MRIGGTGTKGLFFIYVGSQPPVYPIYYIYRAFAKSVDYVEETKKGLPSQGSRFNQNFNYENFFIFDAAKIAFFHFTVVLSHK